MNKEYKGFLEGAILGGAIMTIIGIAVVLIVAKSYSAKYSYSYNTDIALQNDVTQNKMQLISNIMSRYDAFGLREDADADSTIMNCLLNAYDDEYAMYFSKNESEKLDKEMAKEYAGFGFTLQYNPRYSYVEIIDVNEEGPAKRAGIQVGDVITKINDENVYKMKLVDLLKVTEKLEIGQEVKFTITRMGKTYTYNLAKEEIEYDFVDESLQDDITYIKLDAFSGDASEQLRNAVEKNIDNINKNKALILDLRENGGGNIGIAQNICGCFLGPDKTICYLDYKSAKEIGKTVSTEYESTGKKLIPDDIRIVILTSGSTASASELMIMALQDNGLDIKTVGDTTFGKGIAQGFTEFDDGSRLKYTTGLYYSPKHRNIHGVGIKPDIMVYDYNKQLETAIEYIKGGIK